MVGAMTSPIAASGLVLDVGGALALASAFIDVGIEGVTLHDLRHAYGSRLASKGLTARQIADAMGHKKTSTTEIYIQRFNGDQATSGSGRR
jgi:integrase